MREIFQKDKFFEKYEPDSMTPNIKIYWKKAKDYFIWDSNNKKYIDFTSSIFVSNIGHSNNNFKKKLKGVLDDPISHSYIYYNKYRQEYISKLIKFINKKKLNKCFFVSAGTESTEVAFKLMRLNGLKKDKQKIGIICLKGNWHGRTMGAQLMSDNKDQSKWITTKDKDVYYLDFPYPWVKDFDKKEFFKKTLIKTFGKNFNFKKKISGIMIEAFQGWGALFYPKNFIKELVSFAKKNDVIISIDEMQSGFARTGKKFCFEHYNFTPDILCCGKGMGSGMPLSGVVTSKKIMAIDNANLQSTHSGNPLSCAAGAVTIDEILRLKLTEKAKRDGIIFGKFLEEIKNEFSKSIKAVTYRGLIGAIIFNNTKKHRANVIGDIISRKCLKKGLLVVNTGRDSIKLGPPLTISTNDLKKSMKIIQESVRIFFNENN